MRVEVLRPFKDKHSGEIHKKGEVLTITKKRYEEIAGVDKKLVAEVKATEKAAE
jgi:hypothetical protein